MFVIERFVILLYDRTSICTDINKARQILFARRTNVKAIPPTRAALEQHVKRAVCQGGYVWGQSLVASPVLPPPTSWGWMIWNKDEDKNTINRSHNRNRLCDRVCYRFRNRSLAVNILTGIDFVIGHLLSISLSMIDHMKWISVLIYVLINT